MKTRSRKEPRKKLKIQWSKWLTLLVILCGFVIAQECIVLIYLCIRHGFTATAAYLTAAIGLAEAVIAAGLSGYLSLCKVEHKGPDGAGITYATAQANGFQLAEDEPPV